MIVCVRYEGWLQKDCSNLFKDDTIESFVVSDNLLFSILLGLL